MIVKNKIMFYLLKLAFPQVLGQAHAVVLVPLQSKDLTETSHIRQKAQGSSLRLIQIDLTHQGQHALLHARVCPRHIVENPIWLPKKNIKKTTLSKQNTPYTPEQVTNIFAEYGVSISEFCRKHNLSRMAVVDLLRGAGSGTRGDSHRAAVLLGLKPDPTTKQINHPFANNEEAA